MMYKEVGEDVYDVLSQLTAELFGRKLNEATMLHCNRYVRNTTNVLTRAAKSNTSTRGPLFQLPHHATPAWAIHSNSATTG